jgi:hypothetical protein
VKVLVFAHRLELGGTQTNAIELAGALRDRHGCKVVLFATPGPAVALAAQRGLRVVPAPHARFHPSPARAQALREVVRQERPDLIHAWDWWQCMDAYLAVHLLMRVPMVVSDMMMSLTPTLPKHVPITFGTPELVDQAKRSGWSRACLLLPPVDVTYNSPEAVSGQAFRSMYQISDREMTLVTVSRLSSWMKLESLLATIAAVGILGRDLPVRLIIVGDGLARPELERAAHAVNATLRRPGVILTGAMVDPRPAYAAADVVVGMGGSALRGMAFQKPVIVVGERGFCALLTPASAANLLYRGLYGLGDGGTIQSRLCPLVGGLWERKGLSDLGEFSRAFVTTHFGLEPVSARFVEICRQAVMEQLPLRVAAIDAMCTAARYLRHRGFLVPSADPFRDRREGVEGSNA